MQADLPRAEDRCKDDDWVKAAIDLTDYLFWLDEGEAWHWLVPRLVESLVYSRKLRHGLIQVAENWSKCLSKSGKKRVKILHAANDYSASPEEQADLLEELMRLEGLGWLKGDGENERRAILDLQRGRALYTREKYTGALISFERAESELPKHGELLRRQLANFYHKIGHDLGSKEKQEESFRAYSNAIRLEPQSAEHPNCMGNVYANLGKHDEAIAAYQRAIALDPNDAAPHHNLGNVYANLGKHDEAIAAYQHAIEIDPRYVRSYYGLALTYRSSRQLDKAAKACLEILKINPNDLEAHNGLGYLYIQLDRLPEARSALENLVDLSPNYTLGLLNLGIVKWRTGDIDGAKRLFGTALATSEDKQDKVATKGWLQVVVGERELGLETIRKTIGGSFNFNDANNLYDWTNALLKANDPPMGLQDILHLVQVAMNAYGQQIG